MVGSSMYDQLQRAATHRRGTSMDEPRPWSTPWMAQHSGASVRQLNYWIEHGLLGRRNLQAGQGSRRRFTAAEFEVVAALVQLAALGAQHQRLEIAARAVRAARVNAMGERLVLLLDGTCFRHPAGQPISAQGPMWVVPLVPCPFSPAGDPSDGTAGDPAGASSKGAA